jgi:hypothetical protein
MTISLVALQDRSAGDDTRSRLPSSLQAFKNARVGAQLDPPVVVPPGIRLQSSHGDSFGREDNAILASLRIALRSIRPQSNVMSGARPSGVRKR